MRFFYVWVGNFVKMCGGYCVWLFFKVVYGVGFQIFVLKFFNGDVGIDGMFINVVVMFVGIVINFYGNGYFQGDVRDLLEIVGVCVGIYGKNFYFGYLGEFFKDFRGVSFNMYGVNCCKFFLLWVWNLFKKECVGQV